MLVVVRLVLGGASVGATLLILALILLLGFILILVDICKKALFHLVFLGLTV
jgi:hypothetical protein